jgi:hypothetical protein
VAARSINRDRKANGSGEANSEATSNFEASTSKGAELQTSTETFGLGKTTGVQHLRSSLLGLSSGKQHEPTDEHEQQQQTKHISSTGTGGETKISFGSRNSGREKR